MPRRQHGGSWHRHWQAQAMVTIARGTCAPRHLVLGAWGFDAVVERMEQRVQEISMQRDVSLSADFDKEK